MHTPNKSISYNIFYINNQAMHGSEKGRKVLLGPIDKDHNTIAHLAVEEGYVAVFKVCIYIYLYKNL